jgi:hypothetical protein
MNQSCVKPREVEVQLTDNFQPSAQALWKAKLLRITAPGPIYAPSKGNPTHPKDWRTFSKLDAAIAFTEEHKDHELWIFSTETNEGL